METKLSILVVEDNKDIASQLVNFLADKGVAVDYAHSGQAAISLMCSQKFDLVILDLMLPDADGYSLCRKLKAIADHHLPVLMLTARDSLQDKLFGFEVGADDYLTKPFSLEEVHMRCLALGRRALLHKDKVIELGDIQLDLGQRTLKRQGYDVLLSQTDFEIVRQLALAFPNVVSKRQLSEKIWVNDMPETDALRSHIYVIRNALDKPFSTSVIKTVHGIGFKLDINE